MNKTELIDALSVRLAVDKKLAGAAVEGVIDVVTRTVAKGERVAITGFGVFDRQERPARTARNPRTGESIKLKKRNVPVFRPGQGLRDVVSGTKKLAKATAAKSAPAAAKSAAKAATKAASKTVPAARKAAKTATAAAKKTPAKKTPVKKSPARKAPAK